MSEKSAFDPQKFQLVPVSKSQRLNFVFDYDYVFDVFKQMLNINIVRMKHGILSDEPLNPYRVESNCQH